MSNSTLHILKRFQILNNKITLILKVLYYPCSKLNSVKPKKNVENNSFQNCQKGISSSSSLFIFNRLLIFTKYLNTICQGCAEKASLSRRARYLWCQDGESRQLISTCMARSWMCGGNHTRVKCTCGCLLYDVFMNKLESRLGFKALKGNKTTRCANTAFCRVSQTHLKLHLCF